MTLTAATEEHLTTAGVDVKVWRRYKPTPGHLVVVRDRIEEQDGHLVVSRVTTFGGKSAAILGTQDETKRKQAFEPWATVLMIGAPRMTDYGTTIQPPEVKEGQRILVSPTGGRDVVVGGGGTSMTITVIAFEAIVLIDIGEGATN